MSNFNDPLDELIRKHEIASKGENVENTNETQTPPVPDQIILPTTEPESIDIDYGDNDLNDEIINGYIILSNDICYGLMKRYHIYFTAI